jgi:VWFA-related protein
MRFRSVLRLGPLILVAVLHAPAQTQTPPQVAKAAPNTTVSVTTRLVQVAVVVHDKNGQPLRGLTRGDFTVLDQGVPQTVAHFSEMAEQPPAPLPTPLASNVFSNRFEDVGPAPANAVVLLLDALNTRSEDLFYARLQTIKFLQQLSSPTPVAVYALETSLRILQEFTVDRPLSLKALDRFSATISGELSGSVEEAPDLLLSSQEAQRYEEFLGRARDMNAAMNRHYLIRRVEETATALNQIAYHLSGVPGRKSLIWISGGFPIAVGLDGNLVMKTQSGPRSFSPWIEGAARALTSSNIAIYPVDARGLMTYSGFHASVHSIRPDEPPSLASITAGEMATMDTLAEKTGGQAFYNSNDIAGALAKSAVDGEISYLLDFYPTHGRWDGSFHAIKVLVSHPGAHVRSRRGYYATPDTGSNLVSREASLLEAVWNPIDATELGFRAAIEAPEFKNDPAITLVLTIPWREVLLEARDGSWKGGLEVLCLQSDAQGKNLSLEQRHIDLAFEESRLEDLRRDGFRIARRLPLAHATESLRVVVSDSLTHQIGSIRIPVRSLLEKLQPDIPAADAHNSQSPQR